MKKLISKLTEDEFRVIIREEVRAVMAETSANGITDKDEEELVDLKKAVEVLGIAKSTLYKIVGKGEIAYTKQGPKKLLFKRSDLRGWLKENRSIENPKKD